MDGMQHGYSRDLCATHAQAPNVLDASRDYLVHAVMQRRSGVAAGRLDLFNARHLLLVLYLPTARPHATTGSELLIDDGGCMGVARRACAPRRRVHVLTHACCRVVFV